MDSVLHFLLSNSLVAAILAFVLVLVGRLWRHPGLLHMLWLIVLVKLVTPPVVTVPIRWSWETAGEVQASSRNVASAESALADELTMPTHEPITLAEDGTSAELAADVASSVAASDTSQLASFLDTAMMRVRAMPWKGWLVGSLGRCRSRRFDSAAAGDDRAG